MSAIIPDIETLKKVVKINAAIPWESIEPFVNDARDIYIEPQVGNILIELAEEGTDKTLSDKMQRVLGPLCLALATDELGVQYGDSGITVDNMQGKRSPANEAKIAAAKANLFFRGMQALDRLLDYLSRNTAKYPDYTDHLAVISSVPCFIHTAQEYQDIGLVNIDYSTLTYRTMLPTIRQLQICHLQDLLTTEIYEKLILGTDLSAKEILLKKMCIQYLANKSAELYTSQSSRSQRSDNGTRPEYQPVIRPLYNDMDDTGNFFGKQANYYIGKIAGFLTENAEELNITPTDGTMDYNARNRKLFTSII